MNVRKYDLFINNISLNLVLVLDNAPGHMIFTWITEQHGLFPNTSGTIFADEEDRVSFLGDPEPVKVWLRNFHHVGNLADTAIEWVKQERLS